MDEHRPTCRTYNVDGQPVRARSRGPLTERDLATLAEFRELLRTQASLRKAIAAQQATDQKEAPGG